MIRTLIYAFGYLAVLYPASVRILNLEWSLDSTFLSNLYPIFGLIAFSILWLHSISGVFESWLRKQIDFNRYVKYTSTIVFISIILHPFIYLMILDFNLGEIFSVSRLYIWLGIIGWLLLITYDIGKAFIQKSIFSRNWNKILLISTLGFIIIFFHSLGLGSDLQSGVLRKLWIFYGTTGIISTIYTYGLKRLLSASNASGND